MNLKTTFWLLISAATVCWADKFPKPYKNSFEKALDVSFDDSWPQGDWFFYVNRKHATKDVTPNKATDGRFYGTLPLNPGGSFTRFGGYNQVAFPRYGFTTSIDIYLDKSKIILPTQPATKRQLIEYTSAVSRFTPDPDDATNFHRRDFIFHIGSNDAGDFIVSGDNNANFNELWSYPPEATITESGWYTFKHDFHDFGDRTLEVTMTVSKAGDGKPTIGTWKRNGGVTCTNPPNSVCTTDDLDTIVAGNRYGWFTYNAIADLPIDNVTRSGGAIVNKASECANNGWKTVFKKDYKPFSSQKECESYSKKKLRN